MPTTSFVKIYGPPMVKAIRELEKIAVNMPEVCIMDSMISGVPDISDLGFIAEYFQSIPISIEHKRCGTIISKSGERLGEYDFFFEWFKKPSMEQLNGLIEKIDEAIEPLGCRYTITTKK